MMPKLDGTEFLKRLKDSTDLPKPPVLVSSNLSSVKKISDCMALGAIGYVIKSDESMQSIVQDIERIIGERKA
jgi:DNA-binding NarL/FixJ family response regulator